MPRTHKMWNLRKWMLTSLAWWESYLSLQNDTQEPLLRGFQSYDSPRDDKTSDKLFTVPKSLHTRSSSLSYSQYYVFSFMQKQRPSIQLFRSPAQRAAARGQSPSPTRSRSPLPGPGVPPAVAKPKEQAGSFRSQAPAGTSSAAPSRATGPLAPTLASRQSAATRGSSLRRSPFLDKQEGNSGVLG